MVSFSNGPKTWLQIELTRIVRPGDDSKVGDPLDSIDYHAIIQGGYFLLSAILNDIVNG